MGDGASGDGPAGGPLIRAAQGRLGEAGLPEAQLRMMGIAGWTREPKAKLAGQGSCERFI